MAALPHLPRRLAGIPQLLEYDLVPQSIHRLPEAAMPVRRQGSFPHESFERFLFPHSCIALDVVDHTWLQHEESAFTHMPSPPGFSTNSLTRGNSGLKAMAPKRPGGCAAVTVARTPLASMKTDDFSEVDIANAITVGQRKGLVANVLADALEAATGHRVLACVDQRDTPVLDAASKHLHAVGSEVEAAICLVQKVVREVVLDLVAAISAADHEVPDPVRTRRSS